MPLAKTTRAQREAILRLYNREHGSIGLYSKSDVRKYWNDYKQFRRTVLQGWGCLMVPWCGMWVGIEKDGHTHT